ncbi:MAG: hypothetical protein LQ338_004446 [Usnochroma carphineum]|nr:MAG: hypothetical protein LQ338_004446 [Usnochroma carphineum]
MDTFKFSFDELFNRIPRDGSTIDLQPLISLLIADTSFKFLLGRSLGVLDPIDGDESPIDGKTFLKAWQLSLRSCSIRNSLGLFKFIISKSESIDQWKTVHGLMDFHINRALNGQSQDCGGSDRSLLHNLIRRDTDKVGIRNQIIQGMMAAQDTTAILISNTVHLLSRQPEMWRRLRREVASINLDQIKAEEFKKFSLLRNILYESLRIYPVFPSLARVALRRSTLPTGGGVNGDQPVFVPTGTTVISNFYALHRDQDVYGENIEAFDPDRWMNIQPNPWQFMGFGGGQRACLGQPKALSEASYALVKLAQAFKQLESRDPREWAGDQKLTAKNVNGCKVAFIPG